MQMRIEFNLAALRQIKPNEYLVRFFFGGAITLAAALIAKRFGPAVGGLFLAFPAIFPASITLLSKHEIQKKQKHELRGTERAKLSAALDARGAALGCIGLMCFAAIVVETLQHWPIALTLASATATWFAVSFFLWRIEKRV